MTGCSYTTADACSCTVRSWPYYSHLLSLFVANSLTKLSVSYPACRGCDQGLMMCTDRLDGSCCNFYSDNQCVEQCLPPMTVDSNFSCSEWWRLLSSPISYIYQACGRKYHWLTRLSYKKTMRPSYVMAMYSLQVSDNIGWWCRQRMCVCTYVWYKGELLTIGL